MNYPRRSTRDFFPLYCRSSSEVKMDWPSVFLFVFVVVMIICCGGMMMGMKRNRPSDEEKKDEE